MDVPVFISIGKVWSAMVINMVISGVTSEVSNQYIENKSSSEFSTRIVPKTILEECMMGNDDLEFFL